ncbi:MAG: hypothetical protein KIG27_00040, partial [Oscillospiraceae bacterium]|nr:hypothetical protein [Oscillospiraceae bacterium]
DFSSRQGLKSAGILYVFQAFQTTELAEKIRRSAKTQLCGAAIRKKNGVSPFFFVISRRFSDALFAASPLQ